MILMPAIRAVAQIVFGTVRIDPADVERLQRIAGDQNSRFALGLGRRRRPGTGARSSKRPAAGRERNTCE